MRAHQHATQALVVEVNKVVYEGSSRRRRTSARRPVDDRLAERPTDPDATRVAAALARSQPALVDALQRASRDRLASGAWLVPDDRPRTHTQWMKQPAGPNAQPDLLDRLVARASAQQLASTTGANPFPDADAAIAVATARQGLPPRRAVHPPPFPTLTERPTSPSRTPGHTTDVGR